LVRGTDFDQGRFDQNHHRAMGLDIFSAG
jgi:hypothetical protein